MATQAIAAGPAPLDFTVCIKLSGGIRTEHPAVPQHPSLQAFMEEAGRVFKDATSRVERYFYEPVVSIFELAQVSLNPCLRCLCLSTTVLGSDIVSTCYDICAFFINS